ncbi:hypothetical protein V8E51_011694 [Hyaloscypha variabilis]
MATISIDYDSKGDVELILGKRDNTPLNQAAQQDSKSSEQEEPVKYNVGPLGFKVKEVRLRVSSFKLISSSRYFQTMLEGSRFREGKELKELGFIEIELLDPEDEPTAMMIILGILYGTDIQVPIELDLPTLEKVAILVDKYQWHALVTPHAISWFDKLLDSQGLPNVFDETLLVWLFIAWLFGMKDHFKALSGVAQQNACNSIDLTDEGSRISTRVLKAINERREAGFRKVEQVLEAFKVRLLDREAQKQDELPVQSMLRSMVFGFATFCSQDLELGAFAAPDHAGNSIRSLENRINLSQSMQGFKAQSPSGSVQHILPGGIWDLKSELQKAITELKMDEWGLDYDDFKQLPVSNRLEVDPKGQNDTPVSSVHVSEVPAERG